jgi:hypothetical protein
VNPVTSLARSALVRLPRRWSALLLSALAILLVSPGRAHPAPGSAVLFDFERDAVTAELLLPLEELELSFPRPLRDDPTTVVARHRSALADYVLRYCALVAPDGRAWSARVTAMRVALETQPADLVVTVRFTPPAGAPLRAFTLRYDVICHEVMNHFADVGVRSDWNTGKLFGEPEFLGQIRLQTKTLAVDRPTGSWWRGFRAWTKG